MGYLIWLVLVLIVRRILFGAIDTVDQFGVGIAAEGTLAGWADGVTIEFDEDAPRGYAWDGADGTYAAVTLIDGTSDTYELCADADPVDGALWLVERDGACTIVHSGGVRFMGGDGDVLVAGGKIVGALGAAGVKGRVRAVNTAVPAELGAMRHRVLDHDGADPSVVDVMLGA